MKRGLVNVWRSFVPAWFWEVLYIRDGDLSHGVELWTLFWTIVVILVILWLVGFLYGVGALIHILLVIAVIVVVYRLLTGRNVLSGEKR